VALPPSKKRTALPGRRDRKEHTRVRATASYKPVLPSSLPLQRSSELASCASFIFTCLRL
jgi:hypothetical protein